MSSLQLPLIAFPDVPGSKISGWIVADSSVLRRASYSHHPYRLRRSRRGLLGQLNWRAPRLRCSSYTSDPAHFLRKGRSRCILLFCA